MLRTRFSGPDGLDEMERILAGSGGVQPVVSGPGTQMSLNQPGGSPPVTPAGPLPENGGGQGQLDANAQMGLLQLMGNKAPAGAGVQAPEGFFSSAGPNGWYDPFGWYGGEIPSYSLAGSSPTAGAASTAGAGSSSGSTVSTAGAGLGVGAWVLPLIGAAALTGSALYKGNDPEDVFGAKGWGGQPFRTGEAILDGDPKEFLHTLGGIPGAIGAKWQGKDNKEAIKSLFGAPASLLDAIFNGGNTMDYISSFANPVG